MRQREEIKDLEAQENKISCPYCQGEGIKCHLMEGPTMSTLCYYTPIYNQLGINENPDGNVKTTFYKCMDCFREFIVESCCGKPDKIIANEEE